MMMLHFQPLGACQILSQVRVMEGHTSDRGNFIADMMLDTEYQNDHDMNSMFLAEQRLRDMENALHGIATGLEGEDTSGKAHGSKRSNKKFECHYCRKSFRDSYNLKKHIRSHTGEKPFSCDVCHKKFARQYTLRVHHRIHTGETPYKCDACHCTFRVRHLMTMHMERYHGSGEQRKGKKHTAMKSGITPQNIRIPHVTQSISQPNVFFVDHTMNHDCDEAVFPVLDSNAIFSNQKASPPYVAPQMEPKLDSFGQSFLEAAQTCTRSQFVAFVNGTRTQYPKSVTSIFSLLGYLKRPNQPILHPIDCENTESFIERATVACYDLLSQQQQQIPQKKQQGHVDDIQCNVERSTLKQRFERADLYVRCVLFHAVDLPKAVFFENSNNISVLERKQALTDTLKLLCSDDPSCTLPVSESTLPSELRQIIVHRIYQEDEDVHLDTNLVLAPLKNKLRDLVVKEAHLANRTK